MQIRLDHAQQRLLEVPSLQGGPVVEGIGIGKRQPGEKRPRIHPQRRLAIVAVDGLEELFPVGHDRRVQTDHDVVAGFERVADGAS